jgi:phage protein D
VAERSVNQPGLPTDYYAPDYRIEIEGQELDPKSKGDILEVKVVMDMENMTSFELNVNNWDDKTFFFKYSDKPTDPKQVTYDLGNRVHVKMGYAGNLLSMARGQITTLAPKFPESGSPTISISGLDGMLKLRDRKPTDKDVKKFVNQSDSDIATIIGQRNGLDVKVTKTTEKHDLVVQKNQDDAQFIMERAKRIDFDCFVQTDPDTGKDTLYFVKPTDGRSSDKIRVYEFEWGKNLINFSPQLTISRQVSKVTVRGWSAELKDVFEYTAEPKDLPGGGGGGGKGTSGPEAAEKQLNGKQEVVVDAPVTSQEEAKKLAISLLAERAYEFITGSGQVIGLPDLRPGDNVFLKNLGKRFSGEYYVKKVEHSLGNNGYTTNFDVRRVYDGETK